VITKVRRISKKQMIATIAYYVKDKKVPRFSYCVYVKDGKSYFSKRLWFAGILKFKSTSKSTNINILECPVFSKTIYCATAFRRIW